MIYDFERVSDGQPEELVFSMAEVPGIGCTVVVDGIEYRRRVSADFVTNTRDRDRKHQRYPYVSNALPPNHPDCKTTVKGKTIIQSKRHEQMIASKYGYTKH